MANRRTSDPEKITIGQLLSSLSVRTALSLIVGACGVIYGVYQLGQKHADDKLAPTEAKTRIDKAPKQVPFRLSALSQFGNEWPRNDYGYEWKIFNDSKWAGKSILWYEMVSRGTQSDNDHFMRVHFHLRASESNSAYCGVYTDFSSPPYLPLMIPKEFNAIEFEYRLTTAPDSSPIKLFIQIATVGVPNYEYHEKEISLPVNSGSDFKKVTVKFADLKTPSYVTGPPHPFDKQSVFRIGFVIRGKVAAGTFDFDNVVFSSK